MANDSLLPMTVRGKQLLDQELRHLIHTERPSVIKAIEHARSLGDLTENADYDAAKERQAWVEARIAEIQNKIANAQVIDPSTITSDKVVFGAVVTLLDHENDTKVTYQVVGADESDVKGGLLSVMSPLARALIGKRPGDTVEVTSPKGSREYEILGMKFK